MKKILFFVIAVVCIVISAVIDILLGIDFKNIPMWRIVIHKGMYYIVGMVFYHVMKE